MGDIIPKLKGDFAGVIIDEIINQWFVDTVAEKGMKFIVAKTLMVSSGDRSPSG